MSTEAITKPTRAQLKFLRRLVANSGRVAFWEMQPSTHTMAFKLKHTHWIVEHCIEATWYWKITADGEAVVRAYQKPDESE